MDLANIIAIYGKPLVEECEFCHGEGCEACFQFGYVSYSINRETQYVFEYPLYILYKKRTNQANLKLLLRLSLTALCLLILFLSYIINIAHG